MHDISLKDAKSSYVVWNYEHNICIVHNYRDRYNRVLLDLHLITNYFSISKKVLFKWNQLNSITENLIILLYIIFLKSN